MKRVLKVLLFVIICVMMANSVQASIPGNTYKRFKELYEQYSGEKNITDEEFAKRIEDKYHEIINYNGSEDDYLNAHTDSNGDAKNDEPLLKAWDAVENEGLDSDHSSYTIFLNDAKATASDTKNNTLPDKEPVEIGEGEKIFKKEETKSNTSSNTSSNTGTNGSSSTHSASEIVNDAQTFLADGREKAKNNINQDNLKEMSSTIYNILLVVGIIIAVIIGIILGIKFIFGSLETKAEVKAMLVPYVIGLVIIFGAFTIWQIVVNVLQDGESSTSQSTHMNGSGSDKGRVDMLM